MKPAEEQQLQIVRSRIDELDIQIQQLITERAKCAEQVAFIKRSAGETSDFYRPEREAQVISEVCRRNEGPLPDDHVSKIFREIMSACLALQMPLKIAFLGPEGTFTQMATIKHFGNAIQMSPFSSFDEVFREVESGAAHYAVLPVENSTEGVVSHTLDRLMNSPLSINGEIELRVHQHLISKATDLSKVKTVMSHQQGLAQARAWLDTHIPNAVQKPVSSTAEAVRQASEDETVAAISSKAAAEIYEVPILVPRVEDDPCNVTRFLIIGPNQLAPTGNDKTSLLVANKNIPGGLFQLLRPLADHGIDMSRIESRPSRRGTWDYVFFIDMMGHQQEAPLKDALDEMSRSSTLFKVLGSYPVGSTSKVSAG